eukprot:scaffold2719_cov112-Skeletonema_marinoi.AAC.1
MGIDPEGIEFDIEMGIDPERKEFEAILKWGSTPNDQQWSEERRRPTKWSERIEGKGREGKGRETILKWGSTPKEKTPCIHPW